MISHTTMSQPRATSWQGGPGRRLTPLEQSRKLLLAHALAPPRHRGASLCRKNSSPQGQLIIGVLDPALAQHLVREIVHVLEDREPCYQPGRQRRTARNILIHRTDNVFDPECCGAGLEHRHTENIRGGDVLHPRCMEQTVPRVSPCNHTDHTEHTESHAQRHSYKPNRS